MSRMNDVSSKPLWQWNELCRALGLPESDGPDIIGITFDSRKVRAGYLFVALPKEFGPRFRSLPAPARDGHDFVEDAVKAGAAGVICQLDSGCAVPHIRVSNTMESLWSLAKYRRAQLSGKIVALTGSAGKTTLKHFLKQTLQAYVGKGNFNNHLGVPLCLVNTPQDASIAVYEIGTNGIGEITELSQLVRPHVAVLLNVYLAHIGNFADLEQLTKEKLSIADGLEPNGLFVLPEELSRRAWHQAIRFGKWGGECEVRFAIEKEKSVRIYANNETVSVQIPGGGWHRGQTLAAAAATLLALKQPLSNLLRIRDTVPAGRGNVIQIGRIELVDDSYNANPASMAAALDQLSKGTDRRRVAILGEMKELGDRTIELHEALAPLAGRLDRVICVGDEMRRVHEKLPKGCRAGYFQSADQSCLEACLRLLHDGDRVLVKGSNTVFWTLGFVDRLVQRLNKRAGESPA